jgi:acyl carrier protein
VLNEEEVIELINRNLGMNLDPKNTPVDVSFKSLGIDSLDFYNVIVELEAMTEKAIPDEDVERLNTIKSLVEYFA